MNFSSKFSKGSGAGFAARIIMDNALVYELKYPKTDNAFFILEVEKAKHTEFLRASEEGRQIDLKDFGKLLYSGYGEPSEEIKEELRKKYGMYKDPE